jgi:hypothetical protein
VRVSTHKNILEESEGKAGCLMVNLPSFDAANIVKWVEKNVSPGILADSGIERCPHISVGFGFAADVTDQEVFKAVGEFTRGRPLAVTLGDVSRFTGNPKYDVLKVDVDSEELCALHHSLRSTFGDRFKPTFDEYHPHLTLAYVLPNAMKALDGHGKFRGDIYIARDYVYSTPGSTQKTNLTVLSESVSKLLS